MTLTKHKTEQAWPPGTDHLQKQGEAVEPIGVEHCWTLKGDKGAIHFVATAYPADSDIGRVFADLSFTNVHEGTVWEGRDVGWHLPEGTVNTSDAVYEDCEVLDGRCYYRGSGLAAWDLVKEWAKLGFGDDTVWAALIGAYVMQFGDEEKLAPDGG